MFAHNHKATFYQHFFILFYFYLCVARHMPVHVTLLVEPPTTQVAGERFLPGVGHQVSLHPALVREHFSAHMTLFLSIR